MKRLNIGFSAGVLLLIWCSAASATTYINATTGKTTLNLSEKANTPRGFYFTQVGNRKFFGDIQITRSEGAAGSYYYNGTFNDRALGPGRKIVCSGEIAIVRRAGTSKQLGAEVTWKVKGGENCASIGQTFKVNLVEPLPGPNASGNYSSSNANTWSSETSGSVTWPAWRVTSRDGELNCRQTPNGAIKRVYRADRDTIYAELRGGSAISVANGEPWLLTRQGCYVRANSQYIEPVSLPG